MKSLKLICTSALFSFLSLSASATCLTFINGKGPDEVGPAVLFTSAKTMCIEQVSSIGGSSYGQVTFADEQGVLAQFAATVSRARGVGTQIEIDLDYGNANGTNVDMTGTRIFVMGRDDAHLGVEQGQVQISDLHGQRTYLYVRR